MNIDIYKIINYLSEIVTFESFLKFAIVYFFIIWIAILLWVIKDVTNRTNNVYIQVLSIFIVLFLSPFWIFIYLLIRPGKTLFEKYYEEIEENLEIFKTIVDEKNKIWNDTECFDCKKLIFSSWKVCPYCWKKQKK